jgi:hypothetical protein
VNLFHSILLEEEYDAKGVPIAARYHEPNKQQLSQTLTEEMVKQIGALYELHNVNRVDAFALMLCQFKRVGCLKALRQGDAIRIYQNCMKYYYYETSSEQHQQ